MHPVHERAILGQGFVPLFIVNSRGSIGIGCSGDPHNGGPLHVLAANKSRLVCAGACHLYHRVTHDITTTIQESYQAKSIAKVAWTAPVPFDIPFTLHTGCSPIAADFRLRSR